MQFRVFGLEEGSGKPVEIIVQAASVGEADRIARGRGCTPRRIEVDEDTMGPGVAAREELAASHGAGIGVNPAEEKDVWRGGPSQWSNLPAFLLCILLIPIPYAIWRAIVTACTSYALTTQRLKKSEGVFNRRFDEIEIYRIKDSTVRQTLLQRIVGIGTIDLVTSDRTHPTLTMAHIPAFREVQGMIRTQTEASRRARGVREIDMDTPDDEFR
ncbi:MAG: PH domain-containing protein [Phycisphaerales bacterium]|nr:PH domain-containing protein [Phycisphaerales bacterium]